MYFMQKMMYGAVRDGNHIHQPAKFLRKIEMNFFFIDVFFDVAFLIA